jgi:hypothetical protein
MLELLAASIFKKYSFEYKLMIIWFKEPKVLLLIVFSPPSWSQVIWSREGED